MKIIPYGRQHIDRSDIDEVIKALRSDWITQGPEAGAFERALAKYCGVKYAVAVSSGTAALHLACIAAGLKRGYSAVTTPITFLATANSVLYTGSDVLFADVRKETANIDPIEIEKRINKKTRVILPVHLSGLPAEMAEIGRIAKRKSLVVIEDACHALGAEYKANGKWVRIGACRHSDMTVFSFHPVKQITTGEGGAITTNNKAMYNRLLALRSHGVYRDRSLIKKHGPWYYEMRELGFNYRMTDLQAALGSSQLKRLRYYTTTRKRIAEDYNNKLLSLKDFLLPPQHDNSGKRPSWHLYVVRLKDKTLIRRKKELFLRMRNKGVKLQVHYMPVYRQPYYRDCVYKGPPLPNAEEYCRQAFSLPIYVDLTAEQQDYVISSLKNVMERLTG